MTPSSVLAWHAHPDVWALDLALAGGYLLALRRWGPVARPGKPAASRKQITLFMLGVLALEIAADWPVHDIAEKSLYSVHMVQHLLMAWVAVPLLLLGTPDWLFRRLFKRRFLWSAVRTMSRPFYALVQFNIILVLTHWPLVVNTAIQHHNVHFLTHVVLVVSAVFMWMPIVSPVLEIPRLSYPGQMVYLFLQSLVPTVPASFLTFGARPLYHVYETLPRLGGISARTDQMVAGLIMKLVGGFLLWGIIAVLFFKWFAAERQDGVDLLKWRDVDRELNRMELTKR
jgi:putative membrane protein